MLGWTLIMGAAVAAASPPAHTVVFIADDPAWIRAARAKLGERVLDVDAVKRAQVDAAKLGVKCAPGDAACAAKIGVLAGADSVVIVRGGGGAAITFVSVDGSGKELHASGPWPSGLDLDDVVDGVGAALDPKDGFILVKTAAPKKVRVKVDGNLLKKPRAAVAPGAHDVLVEKDGFNPFNDRVDVAAGAVVVVAPLLSEVTATTTPTTTPQTTAALTPAPPAPAVDKTVPPPASPGNPGLLWAIGAGAAGVVAVGAGVVAASISLQLDDPNSDLSGHPAERLSAFNTGQLAFGGAVVAGVAAAGLGTVGALLWE